MAKLTKMEDRRSGAVRYRLRYTVHFPDGSRAERSRRYGKVAIARAKLDLAGVLESRTRQLRQAPDEITVWRHEGLVSRDDAKLLNLAPPAAAKTLEQAMEEYRATWDVSPDEVYTRNLRIQGIKEILGADTAIANLGFQSGELLKEALKKRGLKIVTIRKYLQDLKRCFRHQVRLQVLSYNPFAEISAGRVPSSEKAKQVRLGNAQIVEILKKAGERVQSEKGWPVLDGWLEIFLLLFFGTGLRRKEAMLARWEHIDWESRSLLVPDVNAKDRDERRVGLGRRLQNELWARRPAGGAEAADEQEKGFILPRFHPDTITKAVREHFKKCEIAMRLHDTRHTYATLLQEDAGARPDQAMQRTGHDDLAMLSHYTHPQFGEVLEDRFGFMRDEPDESKK